MRDDAPVAPSPDSAAGGASERPATPGDDRVAAVFTRARANVARRVAVLRALTDTLVPGRLDDAVRSAVRHEAHTLAGTAGTFGLGRISELAAELEELLDGRPAADGDGRRVCDLVRQMAQALARDEP